MSEIRALWRGEIGLSRTYWLWGFLIQGVIIGRLGGYLVEQTGSLFLVFCYLAFVVVSAIFMIVAIWRSAANYKGLPLWAWLARIVCVLNVIVLLYVFTTLMGS
jgi:hypothetical protein